MGSLNTLYIASDGYLSNCNKTLMPATNGYWYVCVPTIVIEEDATTGGNSYFTYREGHTVKKNTRKKILEEDAEILLILKTFVKCQD